MSINWGKDLDLLLHDFVTLGVVAAGIFVKNEKSRAHAAVIIQAVQQVVEPMADDALGVLAAAADPTAAPAAATTIPVGVTGSAPVVPIATSASVGGSTVSSGK